MTQRQPVAYQCRMKTTREGSEWRNWHEISLAEYEVYSANPGPNILGVIREVRPLFDMADEAKADHGEVERLRAEIERMRERVTPTHKSLIEKHAELIKQRDTLRAQLADQELENVRKEAVILKFEGMLLEAYELLNTGERSQALRERIAEALPKVRCTHDFEARAADGGAISMSQPTISICAKCGEQEDE
jgi:hypothetical protein